jgi:hypothetical protein
MNKTVLLALIAGLALTSCGKKSEPKPAPTNTPTAGANPLNAPADYLGALNQAQKVAVKTIDLASLNQAIQAFNASEDHWPADLNELVAKKYLPRLPEPPRGARFEYNPSTGQVRVTPLPPTAPPPPPPTPQ